ncbi:MAG: hypothetical protein AMXMBFR13_44050 [Phycisphaerae bacterium]
MDVQLKPELKKFIDEQVQQGSFSSPTEVLEAGLARLMLDPLPDELDARDLAELGDSIDQMRRGEVIPWETLSPRLRSKYLSE